MKYRNLITLILMVSAVCVQAKTPTVMLLIEEKNLGTIPTSEAEAMASRLLLDEGIKVVDQEMVRANLKKNQQMLKMAGDAQGAVALGLQFGADIVLSGDAVAKPSARRIAGSNLRTYQAVVTLRAIHTGTSETLGSASETASVIDMEDVSGGSKALKAAGQQALHAIVPEMLASWEESMAGGISGNMTQIKVTVGGLDKVWKLRAMRKTLRSFRDRLESVTQESYTAGAAVFEVLSSMPAEELAEYMVINHPARLRIQVLDVSDSKINIRAVESE